VDEYKLKTKKKDVEGQKPSKPNIFS